MSMPAMLPPTARFATTAHTRQQYCLMTSLTIQNRVTRQSPAECCSPYPGPILHASTAAGRLPLRHHRYPASPSASVAIYSANRLSTDPKLVTGIALARLLALRHLRRFNLVPYT